MWERGPQGWVLAGAGSVLFGLFTALVIRPTGPGGPWAAGGFFMLVGTGLLAFGLRELRRAAAESDRTGPQAQDVQPDDPSVFTVVIRGYDRTEVDELVRHGWKALNSGSHLAREDARTAIESAEFQTVLRGYDTAQVRSHLARLSAALAQANGESSSGGKW